VVANKFHFILRDQQKIPNDFNTILTYISCFRNDLKALVLSSLITFFKAACQLDYVFVTAAILVFLVYPLAV